MPDIRVPRASVRRNVNIALKLTKLARVIQVTAVREDADSGGTQTLCIRRYILTGR